MNDSDVQIELEHDAAQVFRSGDSPAEASTGVPVGDDLKSHSKSPDEKKHPLGSRAAGGLRPPVGSMMGVLLGFSAAVLYTMANIALRHCVEVDPFLVAAVKAAPTVILLSPFLLWMLMRGEALATSRRLIPRFIIVSLIGQFVGNAAFQIALGTIGLAASVPITLGVLIVGGAILGRLLLREPVRLRTIVAMVMIMIAVVVLSHPSTSVTPQQSPLQRLLACVIFHGPRGLQLHTGWAPVSPAP